LNAFLLSLGIAIALALVTAFAVPFFIDWSGQRAFFEERAAEILGRPVEFAGPLEVRLVPFPSLTARDVRIGGEADTEDNGVDQVVIRAALAPLLSGELNISEIVLTGPRVTFILEEDGQLSWGPAAGERILPLPPARTRLERFEIVDGVVQVHDMRSGERHEAAGLNLTGSAGTLAGPFRVEGGGFLADQRHTIRIATGRLQEDGSLRFTASIVPADRPVTLDLDGALKLETGQPPRYRGAVVIARPELGEEELPWRIDGDVTAAPREVSFEQLAVNVGPETHRITLSGTGDIAWDGEPRFHAALSARQFDLDRVFGGGPDQPVAPGEALARIGELFEAAALPFAGQVAVEVGSVVVSGNLLESVGAELEIADSSWRIRDARASGPGRSDVTFAGSFDVAAEQPVFEGLLELSTQQSGVLANWLFGPDAVVPGLGAVAGPLDAAANLHLEGGGIELADLVIETAATRLTGEMAYLPGQDGERPGFVARIESDRLVLGGARFAPGTSALAGLVAMAGQTDLDLAIDVGTVSAGSVDLRDVTAVLALSEGDIRIDRLRVGDMQGARLDGYGLISDVATTPEGRLEFDIAADSLDAVTEILSVLGLAEAADSVRARGDALVPARLALSLDAGRTASGESRATVSLEGMAGGTTLDASVLLEGRTDRLLEADFDFMLEAANDDGALLVEQLGFPMPGQEAGSPGRISLSARGRPDTAMPFHLEASVPALDGRAEGDLRFAAQGGYELSGEFDLTARSPQDILDTVGIVLPGEPGESVAVTGGLSAVDDVWRFSDLAVGAGGGLARGALAVDFGGGTPALQGEFELGRLDLPWLLGVLLGADAWSWPEGPVAYGDPVWPQAAFSPLDTAGWRGRLNLSVPQLGVGRGLAVPQADIVLDFSPGRFVLEEIRGGFLGGQLSAELDLAIIEGAVQFDGRIDLTGVRIEEMVWRSAGRALASGEASLTAEVTGSGRSVLAVMSSLTGDGWLSVENGIIRRFNPRAFDQIVRAADAGMDLEEDEVSSVFASHLDAGSLVFQRAEGAFALAAGVARTRNVHLDTAELESFASATLDLPSLGVDSEWTLRTDAQDIEGRVREVGIIFAGPLAAPVRQIDVNPLLGYLTVRAFEQEVERLEALQAEIDARAWLGRELLRFGRESRRFQAEREERERQRAEAEAEEAARQLEEVDDDADAAVEQGEAAPEADAAAPAEPGAEETDFERLIQDALRGPGPEPQSGQNDGAGSGDPINTLPPASQPEIIRPPPRLLQPAPPQQQTRPRVQPVDPSLPVR
jgi:uncharacterized protein involved in outer membrane biogenesis